MSEQWSGWIDHKPGDPCPIPWAKRGQWCWMLEGMEDGHVACKDAASDDDWKAYAPHQIIRYRYRLDLAPAGFVPPGAEKPWVPPVQEGFGPWVEHSGNEQPIPDEIVCFVLLHEERTKRHMDLNPYDACPAGEWHWRSGSDDSIVAYAVKLEDQPTQEQVEATQKPETPEADALDDEDPDNQPMFTHDAAGIDEGTWTRYEARQAWQKPTAAPGFMVRDVRSSDGLLTVREADHRLGLWS